MRVLQKGSWGTRTIWEQLLEDSDLRRVIVAARDFYVIVQQFITKILLGNFVCGNCSVGYFIRRKIFSINCV